MIKLFVTVGILFFSLISNAEILITAPPIADKDKTEKLMEPIMKNISASLGLEARYVHQKDWLEYTKNVRLDIYDFLISEAHIASWTIRSGQSGGGLDHLLLKKISENQELILVSVDDAYKAPSDLYHKVICVRPSPSLDAVLLYRSYSDPVFQPVIREMNTGYGEILSMMISGKCDAAVINKYELEKNEDLHVVYRYPSKPGAAITMSKRLPRDIKEEVMVLLESDELSLPIANVISQIAEAPGAKLVETEPSEYEKLDELLQQVWGW